MGIKTKEKYDRIVKSIETRTNLKVVTPLCEFTSTQDKMTIKCYCGNIFECRPSYILNQGKTRCAECIKQDRVINFLNRVVEQVGEEYTFLETYVNPSHKILVRHNTCNHEYYVAPSNFLGSKNIKGKRCPNCNRYKKKSYEYYIGIIENLHPNTYSFFKEGFDGYQTLEVEHNKCNYRFKINANDLMKNERCPKCIGKITRRTNEDYKMLLSDKFGTEFELVSEYDKEIVTIKHMKCNSLLEVNPNYPIHTENFKCGVCNENLLNTEDKTKFFKDMVLDKYNGEFKILGEYVGIRDNVTIEHTACGTIFERMASTVLYGELNCENESCRYNQAWTTSQAQSKIDSIFGEGEYILLEEYINSMTPINILHTECGQATKRFPSSAFRGCGCVLCYGRVQQDNTSFSKRLQDKFDGEYVLAEDYSKARNATKFKHATCGKVFITEPDRLMNSDKRCPYCERISSKGEKRIGNFLEYSGIDFYREHGFEECKHINVLSFDFAIMNTDKILCLIEFDGKQHFEPVDFFGGEEGFKLTQLRDSIKNKYCEDNNIPLLRIPYWDFDNIESILTEYLSQFNLISK